MSWNGHSQPVIQQEITNLINYLAQQPYLSREELNCEVLLREIRNIWMLHNTFIDNTKMKSIMQSDEIPLSLQRRGEAINKVAQNTCANPGFYAFYRPAMHPDVSNVPPARNNYGGRFQVNQLRFQYNHSYNYRH